MDSFWSRVCLLAYQLRWYVWVVYLSLLTRALLMPIPPAAEVVMPHADQRFYFSKTVHVTAYALLAVLTAALRTAPPWRWLFAGFLSLHAFGTEFGQQFVPTRHPSLADAGLDHIGLLLGSVLSWVWWVAPANGAASARRTNAQGTHATALSAAEPGCTLHHHVSVQDR